MSIILQPKPVETIYDDTTQAEAGVSLTAEGARVVSIHGIAPAQTAPVVQVRLSDSTPWMDYKTVAVDLPNALVEFAGHYNRVRVTGLVAGNVVIAQG